MALANIDGNDLLFEDTASKPIPGTIVPCLLCTKPFLMRRYTGEPDQICAECWETYKDTARIICAKCRITVCRAVPKVLDNGYYIKPHSILHIDACNVCRPGIRRSEIIEIGTWMRTQRRGKPTIILPPGYKQKE